jgi:hypothetical protein
MITHSASQTFSQNPLSAMISMTKTRLTKRKMHLLKVFLLVLCMVGHYNRICELQYLLHKALLLLSRSPWHLLMDCGDPLSFLLMTGLTRETFIAFHDILQPPGHHSLERRKWHESSLPSDVQLGLLLFAWTA